MRILTQMAEACSEIDADAVSASYLGRVHALMTRILEEERDALDGAAERVAEQIAADRLVHVFGPGGHSNLASQEMFFRAGGLMHVSAILDEGTLLSNGALRSMAIERTPGYGRVVIADGGLGGGRLLILVNAYGINAALIDAALEARRRGVFTIGVSSRGHADEHLARPSGAAPDQAETCTISSTSPSTPRCRSATRSFGVPGMGEPVAAVSTFANAFALNCLVLRTVAKLVERGIEPPVWRSGNAPGGDEANARFLRRFRDRVRAL